MPKFRTKPVEVEAVCLQSAGTFGLQEAQAGDYLVVENGEQKVITKADFEAQYEAVPQRGRPKAAAVRAKTKRAA